jgi:hypothetical protein
MENPTSTDEEALVTAIHTKLKELQTLAVRAHNIGLNTEVSLGWIVGERPVTTIRMWREIEYLNEGQPSSLSGSGEYPLPDAPAWMTREPDGIDDIESKLIDSLLRVANSGARVSFLPDRQDAPLPDREVGPEEQPSN